MLKHNKQKGSNKYSGGKKQKKDKDSRGGKLRTKIELSTFVSTKPTECSDFIDCSVCSDKNILTAIVLAYSDDNSFEKRADSKKENEQPLRSTADNNEQPLRSENGSDNDITNFIKNPEKVKKILEKAKNKLKCDSEACVVSHPEFKKFAISNNILTNDEIEDNIDTRFKIEGPRNSTKWLSNYDIDKTLEDWAFKFEDFFPCPFAMIDFDKMREPLYKYDMGKIYLGEYSKQTIMGKVKLPYRTFGCAINTDTSLGKGKHWMALFVDMRGDIWTIEFFNSTGMAPQKSIVSWQQRTKDSLDNLIQNQNLQKKTEIVIASNLEHQESNTECGLYTLFYIRARIENVPYTRFLEKEIPDENMIEFRKHCFRAEIKQ